MNNRRRNPKWVPPFSHLSENEIIFLMIWNDEDISIVYLLKPNKPITLHCDKAHIGI